VPGAGVPVGPPVPDAVTLKKKGSIDFATFPVPALVSKVFVVKLAFRWNFTPFGKLALSGVLFAQNTP
jgi:hypothetical protein